MAPITLAYNTQFQFWYREALAGSADLSPHRRRVSFRRIDYTGEVIDLTTADEPYELTFDDNTDTRFESILPSKVTFSLFCEEIWQAQSLYVDTDRELQVIIEIDTTDTGNNYVVEWLGWVLPQDLKEDFMFKPYGVTVSAACGLSTLKERPLLDGSKKRLTGLQSISKVIRTALDLTGNITGLVTAMNLFDRQSMADKSGGLALPERDPLNRVQQNTAGLVTDKNEALSAYDTLKKDLEPFGCRVAMVRGTWHAVRADEAAGGWDKWNTASTSTIHARTYGAGQYSGDPTGHSSLDLNVYVGSGYPNKVLAGGATWLQNPKTGVLVEQKFGPYINKLANGDFSQIDNTGLPIGWRRKNSDAARASRVGTGTDADPYRVRIYGSDYEPYIENETQGIDIQFHYDEGSAEQKRFAKVTRTLKGRFRLFNARGAKIVIRCSRVLPPLNPWFILADGDIWIGNPKAKDRKGILVLHDVLANNVDTPKPGWCDFSIKIPPMPMNELNIMLCKPYTLELYDSQGHVLGPVTTPEPFIEYADIELVEEDETIKIDGIQRTIVQRDKAAETVLTMTLGDVPDDAGAYDRENGLFDINGVATVKWYSPDADIQNTSPTGNIGKPLIDWNVESRAKQDMYAALTFEGTIYGRLPYSIHSVLRFAGVGEEDENGVFQLSPFQITRLTSRFRSMEHEVTAVRMLTGVDLPAGAGAYTDKREWQSGGETILIDIDPVTGKPVGPTLPEILPPDVSIKKVIDSLGLLPGPGLPVNAPSLYVPADATDPQFTATGRVDGVVVGRTVSALRRTVLFETPG